MLCSLEGPGDVDNDFVPDPEAEWPPGESEGLAEVAPPSSAVADSFVQQQREARQVAVASFGLKTFLLTNLTCGTIPVTKSWCTTDTTPSSCVRGGRHTSSPKPG